MQISLSEWHFSALCDPKVRTIRMQEVISIFLTPNREKGHSSHFNSRLRVNSRGVMASLASQASENVQSQFECRIASFAASSYLYVCIHTQNCGQTCENQRVEEENSPFKNTKLLFGLFFFFFFHSLSFSRSYSPQFTHSRKLVCFLTTNHPPRNQGKLFANTREYSDADPLLGWPV